MEDRVETVIFNGIEFRRYPDSTNKNRTHRVYFTPSPKWQRQGIQSLHREIWKAHYGSIPPGHVIHHKDRDTSNNDINNLECVPARDHHRQHSLDVATRTRNCIRCGAQYETTALHGHEKFCSATCRTQHRVESGVDDEDRVCAVCGRTFRINRYRPMVTCSRSCGAVLAAQTRRAKR